LVEKPGSLPLTQKPKAKDAVQLKVMHCREGTVFNESL